MQCIYNQDVFEAENNASEISRFANEQQEGDWWASPEGREFVKGQAKPTSKKPMGGSKLVAKLGKPSARGSAIRRC
jgi:hypothetical protein